METVTSTSHGVWRHFPLIRSGLLHLFFLGPPTIVCGWMLLSRYPVCTKDAEFLPAPYRNINILVASLVSGFGDAPPPPAPGYF